MLMVRLTIDDKVVEVEEGSTILAAANKAGVNIPTLCHHESLSPSGSCRLCAVEIMSKLNSAAHNNLYHIVHHGTTLTGEFFPMVSSPL